MSSELLELWGHQKKARIRAEKLDSFGLFFEVGAGKTGTCIAMLRDKFKQNSGILKTLVICPPIVIENWNREFGKFSKVQQKNICPLIGPGKKRLELFKSSNAKIFITNYEVLSVASMKPLYEAILEWSPEALVLDESHKVKDMKSTRTKKAIKIADLAKHKYILSGTPILNSLMDIFTQYRVLDGGESFGKNFFTFRAKYFYDANKNMPRDRYFPNWKTREEAATEIKSILERTSMHVTKDECLDLPPLVKKTIYVEMTKSQKKLYDDMRQDLIAIVEDKGAAVAELAITKALRMQQIVSGYVPLELGGGERKNYKIKDNPRALALREVLDEITPANKVIVWAVFKENYNDIREVCEKLKLKYVEVHGGVSQKDKMLAVDSFNDDPSVSVLIGHPGSGGIGINLVSASYSVFYSRSFSLEYDIQAEARNYRGGSEIHDKVTRIDLLTQGTIDELVLKSLASKQNIGYQVLKENMETL